MFIAVVTLYTFISTYLGTQHVQDDGEYQLEKKNSCPTGKAPQRQDAGWRGC